MRGTWPDTEKFIGYITGISINPETHAVTAAFWYNGVIDFYEIPMHDEALFTELLDHLKCNAMFSDNMHCKLWSYPQQDGSFKVDLP